MKPGDSLPDYVVGPVDPEKMKIFAGILRDPNPIHWDRTEVAKRGLGDRLINQGPSNLGYITEMLSRAFGGYTHIKRLTVRFTANVFEGDTVTAGGVVTAVRGSALGCDVWLDRDDGERAIAGTAIIDVSA